MKPSLKLGLLAIVVLLIVGVLWENVRAGVYETVGV